MADVQAGIGPFLGVFLMSMQGIDASLSPLLGGFVAEAFGYRATCLLLGAIAVGSLLLWCGNGMALHRYEGVLLSDDRRAPSWQEIER
jgi:MFS family permease